MGTSADPVEGLTADERAALGRIFTKLGLDSDAGTDTRFLAALARRKGPRQSMRIQLLGGFRVSVNSAKTPDEAWRRRKPAAVLKLLALAPGRRRHREEMMDILWPELDPSAAGANLRKAVYHARAALEATSPGAADMIVTASENLALAADDIDVDLDRFRTLLEEARRRGDIEGYRRALDLYQGDLLPEDPYEEWTLGARREVHLDYVTGLAEMVALLKRAEDVPAAILAVRRLVAADPTQDDANATLMRLYASAGRRTDALRHYEHFRQILDRELGAEPGLATQRLSEEIRTVAPLAPCSRPAGGRRSAVARLCHVPGRTLTRRVAPSPPRSPRSW